MASFKTQSAGDQVMWNTTVHVGRFHAGFDYALKPRRWFWLAKAAALFHLIGQPHRWARISKA